MTRKFILAYALGGLAAATAAVVITASTVGFADSSGTVAADSATVTQSLPGPESTTTTATTDAQLGNSDQPTSISTRASDDEREHETYRQDDDDRGEQVEYEHDDDD